MIRDMLQRSINPRGWSSFRERGLDRSAPL